MKVILQKFWMFMAMLCSSISATAYDFEVDGICYDITSFTNFTVKVSSIVEEKEEIDIPSTVEYNGKTLTVTLIGDNFVKGNENVRILKIGSGIIEIGSEAFKGCSNLTIIEIPETVTKFGASAFAYCTNVIDIEAIGLRSVDQNCFFCCSSLERVNFPRLIDVAPSGFKNCTNLKEINCENIRTISNSAFSGCKSLTSISVPRLISVGENAFTDCKSLTSIRARNLISVGGYAFYGCEKLSIVEFPSLQSVQEKAFANCSSIEDFYLPDAVTDIPKDLFLGCSSLMSVSIGPNIKSIKSNPFDSCTSLKKIVFRDGAERLRFDIQEGKLVLNLIDSYGINWHVYNIFANLPIEEVYLGRPLSEYDYRYKSVKGQEYIYMPFAGSNTLRKVVFGPNVKIIPYGYYDGDVKYREGSEIGFFESCSNLESINFAGNSYVQIGNKAFSKCTSLETVVLPHNVIKVGNRAFEQCSSIRDLSIGYSCKYLGSNAFEGCDMIANIEVYAPEPPDCGDFSNHTYTNAKLNIPLGSMDKYKNISPWNKFWNISEDPSLIAFFTYKGIQYEILSEDNVRVVGVDLEELTDIVLTEYVSYENHSFELVDIARDAFKNNDKIHSILIPDNIVELPDALFMECI